MTQEIPVDLTTVRVRSTGRWHEMTQEIPVNLTTVRVRSTGRWHENDSRDSSESHHCKGEIHWKVA